MNCQACDSSVRIDRVIVERITDTVIGALCDTCQRYHLSSGEPSDPIAASVGCRDCDRPASYHLPRIECLIRYDTGRWATVEYTVTDTSPGVCTAHLQEIVDTPYRREAQVDTETALEVS